jgi:superfamily II DNA or RNA helicase
MGVELRNYQSEAIESWIAADYSSILEMATGTGKTLTAVSAAIRVASDLRTTKTSALILVVCPYLHLVDQWCKYFQDFGYSALEACENKSSWFGPASRKLADASLILGSTVVIVATQATFITSTFQGLVSNFSGEIIFLADEVHNLGTPKSNAALPKNASYRLGLSATPERWLDPQGTKSLLDYFGPISYSLDIKRAISLGCLSPYNYYPRIAELSEAETDSFAELSVKLAQILGGRSIFELNEQDAQKAGAVLRARAAILGDAAAKWFELKKDLELNSGKRGQLVYCSEGTSPNNPETRQIDRVLALISREKLGAAAIYEASTPRQMRQELIEKFTSGTLTHLLSMRCLDEGVDIPSATSAYFVASSANPRQFVQRRGRVLRTHALKSVANIYDYFLVPKMSGDGSRFEAEKAIGKRELQRTLQFIDACENKEEALLCIRPLRDYYE